jgi:hypothetical protein
MLRNQMTEEIANKIRSAYTSLEKIGYPLDRSLSMIAADIEECYGIGYPKSTVKAYITDDYKTVRAKIRERTMKNADRKKELRYKRYNEEMKRKNPHYVDFMASVRSLERGNKIEINNDNNYVKILLAFRDRGGDALGKNIEEKTGLDVFLPSRFLLKTGMIEKTTARKKRISAKGVDYLTAIGL